MSAQPFNAAAVRNSLGEAQLKPKEEILPILKGLSPEQLAAVFSEQRHQRSLLAEITLKASTENNIEYLVDFIPIVRRIPAGTLLSLLQGNDLAAGFRPFNRALIVNISTNLNGHLLNMAAVLPPQQQVDLLLTPILGPVISIIEKINSIDDRKNDLNSLSDATVIAALARAAQDGNRSLYLAMAGQQAGRTAIPAIFFDLAKTAVIMCAKATEYQDQSSDKRTAKHAVANGLATRFTAILTAAATHPTAMPDAANAVLDYWEGLLTDYRADKTKQKSQYALAIHHAFGKSQFKAALDRDVIPLIAALSEEPATVFDQNHIIQAIKDEIFALDNAIRIGSAQPQAMFHLLKAKTGAAVDITSEHPLIAIREAYNTINQALQTETVTTETVAAEAGSKSVEISTSYRLKLKSLLAAIDSLLTQAITQNGNITDSFDLFLIISEIEIDQKITQIKEVSTALQSLKSLFNIDKQIKALDYTGGATPADNTLTKIYRITHQCPHLLIDIFSTAKGRSILNYIALRKPRIMRSLVKKISTDNWGRIFDIVYADTANKDWNLLATLLKNPISNEAQRDIPALFLDNITGLKPKHISKIITPATVINAARVRLDAIPALIEVMVKTPALEVQLPLWINIFNTKINNEPAPHIGLSEYGSAYNPIDYILTILNETKESTPLPARIVLLKVAFQSRKTELLDCISTHSASTANARLLRQLKLLVESINTLSGQEGFKDLVTQLQRVFNSVEPNNSALDTSEIPQYLSENNNNLVKASVGKGIKVATALNELIRAFPLAAKASGVSILQTTTSNGASNSNSHAQRNRPHRNQT